MNKPQQIFPLGIQRFLELEQRVSDLEKLILEVKHLVLANNKNLQEIIDALEQENGKASH